MSNRFAVLFPALVAVLPMPAAARPTAQPAAPASVHAGALAPAAGLTVVLGCPHCGNQRSYRVSDNATQSVTDAWSGGGCGRSFRVHVSRGLVQGVWK